MGLLQFLRRLMGGPDAAPSPRQPESLSDPATGSRQFADPRPIRRTRLTPFRYESSLLKTSAETERCSDSTPPYRFARLSVDGESYLNLSRDGDPRWLTHFGLPLLTQPEDLASFLGLKLGKLAWLTHRFDEGGRPARQRDAHYHFQWKPKRSGGHRLIEAPKQTLKGVQTKILRDILDLVPAHPAAHGFVRGCSIRTNAEPHAGQRVVLKFDLANFYASVRYSRVVAIYRSLGYCREVALWLARLTTSAIPAGMAFPDGDALAVRTFYPRHLPQGAPTSPALANLSAFGLDVRLSGLARAYGVQYTRYADDLTFSGAGRFVPALSEFVPLVQSIIRSERFFVHRSKRKVLRSNQRQLVTGVVINRKPNVSRAQFDQLKAILHNCLRAGPASQNRDEHADFAAHLQGRIAHVTYLNPRRGSKLRILWERIDWSQ